MKLQLSEGNKISQFFTYFKIPNFDEIGKFIYPIVRTHVFPYN